VAYILDVMNRAIDPRPDCISLERYVRESSYITRYLSRVIKDKALVIYHVLFHLSWFETGKGEIVVPWADVGSFIRSDQGNIIDDNVTVKRRLPPLMEYDCIVVARQRGGPNEISVHLPSDIPSCRQLIDHDEREHSILVEEPDTRDYYSDPSRRMEILVRDHKACVYCTSTLTEDNYVLDHLAPVSKGGTNRRQNLVAACDSCNSRRSDSEPVEFLRSNYRQQLLTQEEFLQQKDYVEALLADGAG